MKRLIILGTGGTCLDILDAALAINRASSAPVYECAGFLDDNAQLQGQEFSGVRVLGRLPDAPRFGDCVFVNGIGSPKNHGRREKICLTTGLARERFETIVHPLAAVSRFAQIGCGCAVLAGAAVGARAIVEDHVIILAGAIVNHDCRVGAYSCIASGACLSGAVELGPSSYIGSNASVIGGVRMGARCLVGMGSVVLDDVAESTVVAGNPARFLRTLSI